MAVKWGDSKRDHDTILAVWPEYEPLRGNWQMQEMVEVPGAKPKWRDRRIPTASGNVKLDIYLDAESAAQSADAGNESYARELRERPMSEELLRSIQLRVDKGLQSKERLRDEEKLMLAEARRRNAHMPAPAAGELALGPSAERYRDALTSVLAEYPYLTGARVGDFSDRTALGKDGDGVWQVLAEGSLHAKGAKLIERSKIASGFGLNPSRHWGEVKAEIRQMLLPRANQLLQLASVRRLLDEALARGDRVLVCNGIVFWYEDGQVGWQIKATSPSEEADTTSLWLEGTIVSKNHGRIVVLPFVKDSGEHVSGHTKNAPHDGRAKPRHPTQYVEITFRKLDGDLMIGLFGELPYE